MASQAAAEIDDPREAFSTYVAGLLELQSGNGLLPGVLLHEGPGEGRVAEANVELSAVAEQLLERARDAGALRSDFTLSDLAMLMWSFTPVIEATQVASPGAWRRHLTIVLDGLRCATPTPYPSAPLSGAEFLAARAALRVADDGGRIIAANEAMLEAVGLDRTALATTRLNDLVAFGSYQAIETEVATLPTILGFLVPEPAPKRRRRT